MIYNLKYKFYWSILSLGTYLAYSYKLHGYKQDKRLWLKTIGYKIENRARWRIDRLIEKTYGYQGGGGWTGDELEGVDDVEEYIERKETLIKKRK